MGEKMENRGFSLKVAILGTIIGIIIAVASLSDGMGFYKTVSSINQ